MVQVSLKATGRFRSCLTRKILASKLPSRTNANREVTVTRNRFDDKRKSLDIESHRRILNKKARPKSRYHAQSQSSNAPPTMRKYLRFKLALQLDVESRSSCDLRARAITVSTSLRTLSSSALHSLCFKSGTSCRKRPNMRGMFTLTLMLA